MKKQFYFILISFAISFLFFLPTIVLAGDCSDGNIYGPDFYGAGCPAGSYNVMSSLGFKYQTGSRICGCGGSSELESAGSLTVSSPSLCLPNGVLIGSPGWEGQVFTGILPSDLCNRFLSKGSGFSECGAESCFCHSVEVGSCGGSGCTPSCPDFSTYCPGGMSPADGCGGSCPACPVPLACTLTVAPTSGTAPLSVNFTPQTQGAVTIYTLYYGDGQSQSTTDPSSWIWNHTYANQGTYQPHLTIAGSTVAECSSPAVNVAAFPACQNLRKTATTAPANQSNTLVPGTITWQWNAVPKATGYYIYVSRVDDPTSEYYLGATTSTSYTVSQFRAWQIALGHLIGGWQNPWNARYKLRVVAYNGSLSSECSNIAASAIEKPLSPSSFVGQTLCSNITNSSFAVQAQSGERKIALYSCSESADPYCYAPFAFSYLSPLSSGVRLQARTGSGSVVATSAWLKDNGAIAYNAYSLPPLWTVSGLTANTTYNIYGQSRNQDAQSGRVGDYRPGPTDTDWQSLGACSTTNVPAVNYTLTAAKNIASTGTGTITSVPAGINCGADCVEAYAQGTVVNLTPTPAAGSAFAAWVGCDSILAGNVCRVTMNNSRTVTATFNLNAAATYNLTLTVVKLGTGTGTVTLNPADLASQSSCASGTCAFTYNPNTGVTLSAAAGAGSVFTGWSDSGVCSGTDPCPLSMTTDRSITATFSAGSSNQPPGAPSFEPKP